jgi:hypothetical protein
MMSGIPQTQIRTRNFSRVLGPFYVVAGTVVAVRATAMRAMLVEFTGSSVWPWVTGAFVLIGGISIIAFHQYWHGLAAILVSLTGWGMAAKGLFLMAFPDAYLSLANHMIGAAAAWQGAYLLGAVMGVYLTYVGWFVQPAQAVSPAAGGPRDLPRAA